MAFNQVDFCPFILKMLAFFNTKFEKKIRGPYKTQSDSILNYTLKDL